MTQAINQEIPIRPQEKKAWTRTAVFPIKNAISSVTKHFGNPLDVLSLISISAIIILELIGRSPWGLYVLATLTIVLSFIKSTKKIEE